MNRGFNIGCTPSFRNREVVQCPSSYFNFCHLVIFANFDGTQIKRCALVLLFHSKKLHVMTKVQTCDFRSAKEKSSC